MYIFTGHRIENVMARSIGTVPLYMWDTEYSTRGVVLDFHWNLSSPLTLCFLLAMGSMACATSVPPRYYMASAKLEQHSQVDPNLTIQKLDPAAGSALGPGKATIAFVPPQWCIQGTPDDSEKRLFSRAQCLSLIEMLENRARSEGYTVVDSKKLHIDPPSVAKQERIDALFIIDDLVIHSSKKTDVKEFQFAIQSSLAKRTDANIAQEHASAIKNRCTTAFREYHKSNQPFADTITGVTLSMKMVSVKDMSSKWYFNDTITTAHETSFHPELYYLSPGKKERPIGRLIAGTVLTSLGIAAVAVGKRMNDHGESFVKRNAGFGLAWASVIPFGVGLPLAALGLVKTVKPPEYQQPINVLCVGAPMDRNPFLNTDDPSSNLLIAEKHQQINVPLSDHFIQALGTLQLERVQVALPTLIPAKPETEATPTTQVSPTKSSPYTSVKEAVITEKKPANGSLKPATQDGIDTQQGGDR